ncbi:hypothetical protein PPERSA_12309 [Pseudocohnilembus persalinus]|uniref:Uncharacterized protein n=1 Tax=Pseudocohnilembus persalinus TaxID=266149 RepID=A0A0V0R9M1_PSEPJ|nr:hypothetical protein PPERSA_12309 [Pseudocohnilembus persalinus]|eukprot:KRX10981.1 hypothetical protein PPERSA_12309 [Pseudocohnilembus persalinus]
MQLSPQINKNSTNPQSIQNLDTEQKTSFNNEYNNYIQNNDITQSQQLKQQMKYESNSYSQNQSDCLQQQYQNKNDQNQNMQIDIDSNNSDSILNSPNQKSKQNIKKKTQQENSHIFEIKQFLRANARIFLKGEIYNYMDGIKDKLAFEQNLQVVLNLLDKFENQGNVQNQFEIQVKLIQQQKQKNQKIQQTQELKENKDYTQQIQMPQYQGQIHNDNLLKDYNDLEIKYNDS